ncbi:MAG: FAD-dependent oxidoreductase [Promethearchaeota archaeon]
MTEASININESVSKSNKGLVGEVLVVGVGIAGIQASLDLTRLGFHVTAIDKKQTIGGIMAQLDKTFPTNDCSLCILAPKMVEVFRDPNITLYQNTEIKNLEILENGNIKVTLIKKRMGIDESKCKNCGECYNACPVRFQEDFSWFDAGLNVRHATNIPFPSAVPPVYGIREDKCLHVKYGICGKCQDACPSDCIDYDFSKQEINLTVGSIVFATGASQMKPEDFPRFLGEHPDVINGIQFERLMCASGPEGGEIIKLSTRKHAKRIAFLQCVGSRSKREGEVEYCSSVCCMYSMKEAQITKEHDPDVECYIFNTENRACFKGFHEYYLRAKNDYGVEFIPGRAARVREDDNSSDLIVEYEDIFSGRPAEKKVDLVILESALIPNTGDISKILGIELNEFHYFDPEIIEDLESKGIFFAGYNIKPMDIPMSVVSGSSAATKVSKRLHQARFKKFNEKEFPPEKPVGPDDEPRIGVMVCHCGINIGRTVDVEKVAEEIAKEPNVAIAVHNYYSCSSDSQVLIKELIKEHDLNRFIVASCTPRTHEPLFRVTLQEAGLNPYLFELVNIREHDSWVHMKEPGDATQKAIELIRMNIAKVRDLMPQKKDKIQVKKSIMIIGGGPAGLTAADALANQGFKVFIVEKENVLGGAMNTFADTILLMEERPLVKKVKQMIEDLGSHPNVKIFTSARIENVEGFIGNYEITLDIDGKQEKIEIGGIIVATGVKQDPDVSNLVPDKMSRVFTQEEFEFLLKEGKLDGMKNIGFIQCVNQRQDGTMTTSNFPNCSGICCKISLKQALKIHEIDPDLNITILHRGMQLSGDVHNERLYDKVQSFAMFARYNPNNFPTISVSNDKVQVALKEVLTGEDINFNLDALILATPYKSIGETKAIAMDLKVPVTQDGFFLEAHVKLRPVDFATEGVFLAGSAQWPKTLEDAILQGNAAAARASGLLIKGYVEVEGITAKVNEDVCIGCAKCASVCPFSAIEMVEKTIMVDYQETPVLKAHVVDAMCKGCGTCVGECPTHAIDQKHFKTKQISDMIKALYPSPSERCCM